MKNGLVMFALAASALLLCGCEGFRISGPDLPGFDSAHYLRRQGEPEELIDKVSHAKPLPPEMFYRLEADYSNRSVRRILAENPTCPVDLLMTFVLDSDYYVRRGVAVNRKAPTRILRLLINDPYEYTRMSLGQNDGVPASFISELIACNDYWIDYGLCSNRLVGHEDLRKLYRKYPGKFSLWFAMNQNLPADLARDIYCRKKNDQFEMGYLVENPALPEDLILEIYHDPSVKLPLSMYARNPKCPQEIIDAIWKTNDKDGILTLRMRRRCP